MDYPLWLAAIHEIETEWDIDPDPDVPPNRCGHIYCFRERAVAEQNHSRPREVPCCNTYTVLLIGYFWIL